MPQTKESKQSLRPMFVALGVIALAVAGFTLFNQDPSRGSNPTEDSIPSATMASSDSGAGTVQVLTSDTFEQTISEGVVLVDFWATWCPPCRIQGPIVEELALDMGDRAVISKLDVDDHGNIAALYQVRSIPTLIVFRDGEPVRRFVGVQQKETLAAAINELL